MAEFIYNNARNISTGYTPFKLNYGYYPQASYKESINPQCQSKSADKLATKLKELMTICRNNLYHIQKLQKQHHNKAIKPESYAPDDKIWLNNKYIKTKQNRKLETRFFRLSQFYN